MLESEVLMRPFDIETHKKTFVNYLEVVILENGTITYAVPSHQQKLIMIACKKLGVTQKELNDMCPKEYYFDFNTWLCKISNTIAVWDSFYIGVPNDRQMEALKILQSENLYNGKL